MSQVPDMEAICDRYRKLYSGLLYDILDEMGHPDQCFASDIRPIMPDMVVSGPAFTIQGINDPTGDPNLREKRIQLFKEMTFPCVDVRDCSFDTRCAHYGEMNATLSQKYGAVGAVIDGGTRDSRHVIEMGFPVFARYHTPVEALGRWSYYRWKVPITVRGALTEFVVVNPGDFIFGDIDGVLAIPKDITMEVLEKAEKLASREDSARAEFKVGDAEEVYRKYGRL